MSAGSELDQKGSPIHWLLGSESAMRPTGDEPDGFDDRTAPLTLEEAMAGNVDPYAQYTDEHVDTGDIVAHARRMDLPTT